MLHALGEQGESIGKRVLRNIRGHIGTSSAVLWHWQSFGDRGNWTLQWLVDDTLRPETEPAIKSNRDAVVCGHLQHRSIESDLLEAMQSLEHQRLADAPTAISRGDTDVLDSTA